MLVPTCWARVTAKRPAAARSEESMMKECSTALWDDEKT